MALHTNGITTLPILTLTVETADADQKFRRFVRRDGTRAGDDESVLGVSRVRSAAANEDIPVDVAGVVLVEAGGAIAIDVAVASDGQGRAKTHAGNVPRAGVSLAAAAAAGDVIPILLGLAS